MRKSITKLGQVCFILAILMLFTIGLKAQPTDKEISTASLFEMVNSNTTDELCYLLTEDNDNNYYVVNTSKIDSRYVKIRILEQSYESDFLVNIGVSSNELENMIFLVKKSNQKSNDVVKRTLETYVDNSKSELSSMSTERLRLWLIQHDKYQK